MLISQKKLKLKEKIQIGILVLIKEIVFFNFIKNNGIKLINNPNFIEI